MAINKNDFIELEFTGKVKNTGDIFDTNIKSDAQKANLNLDIKKLKPFILSVGHKMLPQGFDEDLEGKEISKKYRVELLPEKAFGKRNSQLIKMIPLSQFTAQGITPQRGMSLNLGGQIVRVLSSSGGRVLVDFNHPLAGKSLTYDYKILRKVVDKNQKINALQDFFFRKKFPFTTNNRIITFRIPTSEKQLMQLIKIFEKQFKEILGMQIQAKIEDKKSENSKKTKK